MLGLASAAWRLASRAVCRTRHNGVRVAINRQQIPAAKVAGVRVHARRLATGESPDARDIATANARIAKKSAASTQLDRMDPETVEQKKEALVQFLESRLQTKRVTAIRTIEVHLLLMVYSHDALERKLDWLTRQASKVEGAKSLGLSNDEVAKLMNHTPQFLALSMDSIYSKLQALDKLLGEGEAVRLWLSYPHLIVHNTEELRRTFEYLTKVVGMTPDRISQNVMFITRNVDRIVRPRYEFLTKIQSHDFEGVIWIRMGETKFVSRHPAYADFLSCGFKPK